MRFLFTGIWGAIAFALYPVGVFGIPFSQLTLGNICGLIGAVSFGFLAVSTLFHTD